MSTDVTMTKDEATELRCVVIEGGAEQVVVRLEGDYEMRFGPKLWRLLKEHIGSDTKAVIIDCSRLDYADGNFPFLLLTLHRTYRANGCSLRVDGCRAPILRSLEITGVADLVIENDGQGSSGALAA